MEWWNRINPQVHETWHGRWKPGVVEPLRTLRDHELVLFTEGECEVEMEGRKSSCPAGTALLVPPGRLHTTRMVRGSVYRYCVHFDWVWRRRREAGPWWVYWPAQPKRKRVHWAPDFVPQPLGVESFDPESPAVVGLMRTLCHRWKSPNAADRGTCRALLLEVLVRLFGPADEETGGEEETDDLAFAVRALLDGLSGPVSITQVLPGLGYSYEHLCRVFRKKFEISPLRYLTYSRLERAKQLLREGGRKISAVAGELGYENGYFIRAFRQYTGMTPGEYARRAEGGRPDREGACRAGFIPPVGGSAG